MPTESEQGRKQGRIMKIKVGKDGTGYIVDGMFFGTREAAQMHVHKGSSFDEGEHRGRPGGPHNVVIRRIGDTFVVDDIMFENSMEAEFFASELARELRNIERTESAEMTPLWRAMGLTFETRRDAERAVHEHARQWAMVRGHTRNNQMHEAFLQGQRDGERIIELIVKEHEAMKAAQEAVEEKKSEKPGKPKKRDRYAAIRV